MNIIYSGFIHPLIGVLSAFLILFGSEFIGKQLLRKIFRTFFFKFSSRYNYNFFNYLYFDLIRSIKSN